MSKKNPHTHAQFKSPEFKKIQAKWYKRLESDGFEDLEWNHPGGQNSAYLKKPLHNVRKNYCEGSVEHYRRARIHLAHAKFNNEMHKFIWTCYTDGQSYRTIIKSIQGQFNETYSVFYIWSHMQTLLAQMEEARLWEDDTVG